MPKLAANLSMMFNEVGFYDRFELAAKAGFKGVEFLFPYEFDLDQIASICAANQLEVVLHNLPAGHWAGGERGIACHPNRIGEFQDGVGKGIEAAKKLGVKQLNALAGIVPEGLPLARARETFIENLRFAAAQLKAEGIRLITEPINTFDIPGFYLNRTQQAVDIIKEVGSDNLFIQHDIYHMQRMEGELANTIKANIGLIKHMQLADNPGRNEPGTGEINYQFLFKFIDDLGYDGWIGCEYRPKTTTAEGLGWVKAHGC